MTHSRYSQTSPRELVHKRAVSEVLITAVSQSELGWVAHTQLPRQHGHYCDAIGAQAAYHDPFLLVEAIRQGGLAGSHLFRSAPRDSAFLVRGYDLAVTDLALLKMERDPLDLELHYRADQAFHSGSDRSPNGLAVSVTAVRGSSACASFQASFSWLSKEHWNRLRAGAALHPPEQPSKADHATVNRANPANVVIAEHTAGEAPGSAEAVVVVDTEHPTLFDHPLDHLPGALVIEAFRQTALAAFGPGRDALVGPVQIRCGFRAFAELHTSCAVLATQDATDKLRFQTRLLQNNTVIARAELLFAAPGLATGFNLAESA